jgi:hypothetical protein
MTHMCVYLHNGWAFYTLFLHKYPVYTALLIIEQPSLHGANMSQPAEAVSPEINQLTHYINGEHVAGNSGRFGDVYNPTLGVKTSETPLASKSEVETAIAAADAAFPAWAATSVLQRSRIMARYVRGIRLRRAARAKRRVLRQRRAWYRHLLDAQAAGRGCRHYAIQLPGDDSAVDGGHGADHR